MMNNVSLIGRLTKDIDLRTTPNGTSVGTFTLAVDRSFKNQNGDRETDFIRCVTWQKQAEILAQYTHKGSLLGIEGSIRTSSYENKEGRRVYVTEVLVNNFTFLDSRNQQSNNNISNDNFSSKPSSTNNSSDNGSKPSNSSNKNPFDNSSEDIDISDDDLPF